MRRRASKPAREKHAYSCWFEVYKIEVLHVTPNRKFKTIKFSNDEIIYQRGEDEDLPINQPLSLCGKPTHSMDYFTFRIGNPKWWWVSSVGITRQTKDPEGIPYSIIIPDNETNSCVQIWCEFVDGRYLAQISVRLLFLDERLKMRILRGQICVTNVCKEEPEYDADRKRLLQLLTSHPASDAQQDIMLDRSVVALAEDGSLLVDVDLIYSTELPGDEERIFSICKSGSIDVPSDRGTYDIMFEPESGASPVVKVEFCVYHKPRKPLGTELEDLQEIDLNLFDD